jgi:hypothetical protein
MKTLKDRIEDFTIARNAYKQMRKQADDLYHRMKEMESELVHAMSDDNLQSVRDADGVSIQLASRVSCSCTEENNGQIRDWLMETVGDDTGFVRPMVHKRSLLEYLKGQLENGHTDADFPDFLRVNTSPMLKVGGLGR